MWVHRVVDAYSTEAFGIYGALVNAIVYALVNLNKIQYDYLMNEVCGHFFVECETFHRRATVTPNQDLCGCTVS